MKKLEFLGEITLEEIYEQNKELIYSSFITEIQKVANDLSIKRIEVMEFKKNGVKFAIDLKRDQFNSALNSAIDFFIEVESYEKCKECKDLINELNM